MLAKFVKLYTPFWGTTPFTDITALASAIEWTDLVGNTTMEYFNTVLGGDGRFTREMIEGATRVNYGQVSLVAVHLMWEAYNVFVQNADRIHGFGGAASLAAEGASTLKGGNWQMFEQFIKRSGATVHLNTTVKSVTQLKEDKFTLEFLSASSNAKQSKSYRAVILAAPYHQASIALNLLAPLSSSSEPLYLNVDEIIPPQPYVHLHVTLLSTPNPSARTRYFGLKDGDHVPSMVLTTWQGVREGEQEGKDVPKPEFNSLSYHGKIKTNEDGEIANLTALGVFGEEGNDRDESGEEWSVKIFSDHRLEDSWLRKVVGKLGWVHRKEVSLCVDLFWMYTDIRYDSGMPTLTLLRRLNSLP